MTDDRPLAPEEMLALLERQTRQTQQRMLAPVPWIVTSWGAAWLLGFLTVWSTPGGGNPWFEIPARPAWIVFALLLGAAVIASAVLGIRIGRGVQGASAFPGAVYGLSWSFGSIAAAAIGGALLMHGLPGELASLLFPALYGLVAGLLYLGGAALWRDIPQLVMGLWLLLVSAVAPFAGTPANYLVMGLLGGGGFLAYGVVLFAIRARSAR